MHANVGNILVQVIREPGRMRKLVPKDWDDLVRLGRAADLLARLSYLAQRHDLWASIPAEVQRHLVSAQSLVARQHRELGYELQEIDLALKGLGVPVVLLKGAAYVAAEQAAAQGRMVSDVDVLVPSGCLAQAEAALMLGGWTSRAKSDYDQRYYRTWMHELPPMVHIQRGTVLDVHHAIMPLSARVHPSSALLLAAARPVPGFACLQVLAPIDQVLHSATHLMHEGEFEQGLRGLVDLDALLQEHGTDPGFWPGLVARAVALELTRPLFYGLRYVQAILGTNVPAVVQAELVGAPGASPSRWVLRMMDGLFLRALSPAHELTSDRWTPLARGMLYLRGHWLRMPPGRLTLHLLRKLLPARQGV